VETSTKLFLKNKKTLTKKKNEKEPRKTLCGIFVFWLTTFYSWNASIGGRG
jgi:hypothetical protein